jgi:NAD(P)-dependent dehydrogenase (short-subunit alcohol dehydrogenase family)
MQIDLTGKTALITGGSRGLGAIALRFARSGADVAILARDAGALDEAATAIREAAPARRVMAVSADLARPAAMERAVAGVLGEFGHVDILVNNAGSSFRRPFAELTRDDILADMDLKLFPALRLAQLLVPGMRERGAGRIINVLSINAKAPKAGSAPTTLSRAAGLVLTKVLAHELAPDNILVNALCVGQIKSGQWARRHRQQAPALSYDAFLADAAKTVPLGRMGEPEEFADVACFIASDAASYVTGTAMNVDGGLSPVI